MKISIDTKEDSHGEIRKVIKMLQHLVGENSYSNQRNIFSDDSPGVRNIFDDPSPSLSNVSAESSSEETESDVGGEAQSAAPTNAFSAMFGDNAPTPSVESSEETSSLEEEKEPRKLNLDDEVIPY